MAPLAPHGVDPQPRDSHASERVRMVDRDLRRRGIRDERVLEAMSTVPRHLFVAPALEDDAYGDAPLPTRDGQTISQPYIVALMTEALRVTPGVRVLEIGTGSGYQTAILAVLGAGVWTVEARTPLCEDAKRRLHLLGISGVAFRCGDGTLGWPEAAPFDRVLATGSLPRPPQPLLEQLRRGGLFVGPIGTITHQRLVRITVDPEAPREETLCACTFVPLIGAGGWHSLTEQER